MQSLKNNTFFKVAIVFLIAFMLFFLCMDKRINVYDEGIVLTAAMRVHAGDIPHRDFYINYGPAEFYVLSWLFDLFGQHVIVERLFDLTVRAGIIAAIYTLLMQYCRKLIVAVIGVISALWLAAISMHGYPIYPALLLAIVATAIMIKVASTSTSHWYPVAAGLLTALTACFRYDIGFLLFVSHLVSVLLISLFSNNSSAMRGGKMKKNIYLYILASAIPVLMLLGFYWLNGAIASFAHDIIFFPVQHYAKFRGLPFPDLFSVESGVVYFPVFLVLAVITAFLIKTIQAGEKAHRHTSSSDDGYRYERVNFLIFFTVLVVFFYTKGIVRIGPAQMQLALIPALIALAVILELGIRNQSWLGWVSIILVVHTSGSALTYGLVKMFVKWHDHVVVKELYRAYSRVAPDPVISRCSAFLAESRLVFSEFTLEPDRNAAIDFIKKNTLPHERIYIGLNRHDKVFVNDVASYFQAQRMPVTKWHHFDPGLQSTAKVQAEIVSDLEKNKLQYVWLEPTWDDVTEPNASAKSSGVYLLDLYIRDHYRLDQTFGRITIWKRIAE